MYFLREISFLFIICILFFVVSILFYGEIRHLRKENRLLRRIIDRERRDREGCSGGDREKNDIDPGKKT